MRTAAMPGNQAFTFIGTVAFGSVAGQLRYETLDPAGTANDMTLVHGDINGDGILDFSLQLTGLFTLTGAQFIL